MQRHSRTLTPPRRSIITPPFTRVLAGAGTGKTSVVVGKVAHLYVAMTRARVGAYLITDPGRPSLFVTELLRESAELRQLGELAPECPRCRRGHLRPSQSPKNLICSDSNCDHRAPRCPNCNDGYALVGRRVASCTNRACHRPATACPRSGLGILLVINSGRGPFWGCTEYRSEPSCRYKKDIESGTIR